MLYTPIADKSKLQKARKAIRKNKLLALVFLMVSHVPKYRPKLEKVNEKLLEVLLENNSVS